MNKLDFDSVIALCGQSRQVAVYGWRQCHYSTVNSLIDDKISRQGFQIQKNVGGSVNRFNLENRKIERVAQYQHPELKNTWKEIETNLVLENCKRKKMGLDLVIILFCIDAYDNKQATTSTTITARDNNYITNSELRRCYKLCHSLPSEICEIAKQTFKFVKVNKSPQGLYLEEIPPFWQAEDWTEKWNERMATRRTPSCEKIDWKTIFIEKLKNFIRPDQIVVKTTAQAVDLIQNGVLSFEDLSSQWQKDREVISAALEISEGEAMKLLPLELQIELCDKDPQKFSYCSKKFIHLIEKALPNIAEREFHAIFHSNENSIIWKIS